ncbi:antibiotic biosynthesis monooxygenase [Aquibacillus sp. 3ASR75-11]|uniref:Antibiotic biosynthesis monooxygenase n=1 Tax=Terrihalobacillus insolitus TaxID=2950438 RepID=A0A9X3WTD7_9BACI|nr:antibiotic biosynthesis monooxygenase [Terrihalobacillus insolitus]MDC3425607.1 antibiotic biosynthesis monooxygenase [Terrihalobacillus insolitus]
MNVHITSGTLDFMMKMKEKYSDTAILLMQNQERALAYYESNENSLFQTARSYEIVEEKGELQQNGYVVMNNIPITDEGRPLFEDQFKKRAGSVEQTPGFQALRVLRPIRGNTYGVLVQWKDEESYNNWRNSDHFKQSHQTSKEGKQHPPYFAGPSYAEHYYMVTPD